MLGLTKSCENEVIAQLVEFNQSAYSNTKDNNLTEDDFFDIKQNTRLVQNAESYYRAMFNHKSSWNIRDMHMIETLDQLVQYLSEKLQKPAKIVQPHKAKCITYVDTHNIYIYVNKTCLI